MAERTETKEVFKSAVWTKTIEKELKTLTGLSDHSNHQYEGEIKYNAKLYITSIVTPSVREYTPGTPITSDEVKGNEKILEVNKRHYYSADYDDVDRIQSLPGVMEAFCRAAAEQLHQKADENVADVMKTAIEAASSEVLKGAAFTPTKSNVLEKVEDGLTALYENNVTQQTKLWGEFSPKMYSLFKQYLNETYTNNVEMMRNGIVGRYGNMNVTIENLLPKNTTSKVRYNIIRTEKAVASVKALEKVQKQELVDGFGVRLKGLMVHGAKVVFPKQMYAVCETYA